MSEEFCPTDKEKFMLHLLHTGTCDGPVGRIFRNKKGCLVSYFVVCGIPTLTISKPVKPDDTGPIETAIVIEYRSDYEKLFFLKAFGHYMRDEIFQEYSKASGLAITLPKSPRELAEEAKAKEMDVSPPKTEIELNLLKRLSAGELDGSINHGWIVKGGSWHWCIIENGIPIQYRQAKDSKFFNGKENETIEASPKVYKKYLTDDEKIDFFQKFGRDVKDKEVQDYYWACWKEKYQH